MAAMITILPITALLILLGAAWSDVRSFRIPNGYPLALILLFIPFAVLNLGTPEIVWHLAHFAIALAVGMLLFGLKWVGGGDAKLYAAIALWFPMDQGPFLAMWIGLSGVIVVLVYFFGRRMVRSPDDKTTSRDRRIPYGVALAVGAILCWLWMQNGPTI